MATNWTPINPQPLKVDQMRKRLTTEMRRVGSETEKQFQATVETWNNQPDFGPSPPVVEDTGGFLRIEVSTDHSVYKLVNAGSPRHWIAPVNAKALAFPGVFSPKTKPRIIKSFPGYSGPVNRFSKGHWHPGFKAREFDLEILKRQAAKFPQRMEKALARAAQASGHSI